MKSENDKFTIVKANKIDIDVRRQLAEIFAEGFTQWLVFFSKDKNIIARAFAHMFVFRSILFLWIYIHPQLNIRYNQRNSF